MSDDLSLDTIRQARERVAPFIRHTPLLPPPSLHADLPPRLRLKLENLQVTGAFKVRGAFNTLLHLAGQGPVAGVVGSSGGNHGVALAYAAYRLAIPATIYLPAAASDDRVARIAAWGARVIRHGATWDEAHARGLEHAAAAGHAYVHPFDAPSTIAGQGTIGLELLDDLPDLDAAIIAIGGGGLIGGIATALKEARPGVRIIGVEPTGAPSMSHSLRAGQVAALPGVQTIADTLAPRSVSARTLALARRYVDDVILVDDRQLVAAMRWLWRECNQLVEPAGAAVIAALLADPALLAGCARPVAVICGGNAAAECVFAAYEQASP